MFDWFFLPLMVLLFIHLPPRTDDCLHAPRRVADVDKLAGRCQHYQLRVVQQALSSIDYIAIYIRIKLSSQLILYVCLSFLGIIAGNLQTQVALSSRFFRMTFNPNSLQLTRALGYCVFVIQICSQYRNIKPHNLFQNELPV